MGGFCSPTNEALRDEILNNTNLNNKYNFLNRYDIIRITLLVALAIGILWMVLVQICPRIMAGVAIGLGSLLMLVGGIHLLIDNDEGWSGGAGFWRILIAVLLILFAILFFVMLFMYRRRIKIAGILLHYAAKFLG